MTHTYSRGCFKLIFRKCLPIHLMLPYHAIHVCAHVRACIRIAHLDVLYRDCPPSRASASSNGTDTHTYSRSSQCFPTRICLSSFLLLPFYLPFPNFFHLYFHLFFFFLRHHSLRLLRVLPVFLFRAFLYLVILVSIPRLSLFGFILHGVFSSSHSSSSPSSFLLPDALTVYTRRSAAEPGAEN